MSLYAGKIPRRNQGKQTHSSFSGPGDRTIDNTLTIHSRGWIDRLYSWPWSDGVWFDYWKLGLTLGWLWVGLIKRMMLGISIIGCGLTGKRLDFIWADWNFGSICLYEGSQPWLAPTDSDQRWQGINSLAVFRLTASSWSHCQVRLVTESNLRVGDVTNWSIS